MADGKVPVTVLTGFLGSGKTTLCAALAGSAAAQHSLRGAGGLEMLIEGIGIDATGTHDAGPAPPGGRAGEVTDGDLNRGDAFEALELGALALDAVRRAVRRNGQNAKRAIDVPTHSDARRTTLPSRAAADVSSKDSAVRRSLPSTGHAVGRRDAAAQFESHVEISGSSCWMASKYAELRR